MSRELDPKLNQTGYPNGAPEALPDDELDIDPAEFFDPEEFGIRQRPAPLIENHE